LPAIKNLRLLTVAFLIVLMASIPAVSFLERSIPTASYEIMYGDEVEENENIEIQRSPFTSVTSLVLINDSLLSSSDYWFIVRDNFNGRTEFTRTIAIPKLNVSATILNLSVDVVTGPLGIFMVYGGNIEDIICQSGEQRDLVRNVPSNEYESDGSISIFISFDSIDWNVLGYLCFSIQVEFNTGECPVTIDLKRTNGESMFLLQEFNAIQNRPTILFGEEEFHLSKANDTLYLPNGNYLLSIHWESYEPSFANVSISNESLSINIKIKSTRLNVESIQKIPGLTIWVGGVYYQSYAPFLLKDSPSFYLPSGNMVTIEVRGEPGNTYNPFHFSLNLDAGDNRNITLVVHENWISLGEMAVTPARLVILVASVLIVSLTLFISRTKLVSSSIILPFILVFLGSIVPSYQNFSEVWIPVTLPLNSVCIETDSISLGIDISVSSYTNSTTVIVKTGEYALRTIDPILFILLLIPFIGVLYEYLRKEYDSGYPDFLIAIPVFLYLLIQWSYVIGQFGYGYFYPGTPIITIGAGPFLTTLAFVMWIIQYKRKGGLLFIAVPKTNQKRKRMKGNAISASVQGCQIQLVDYQDS
jgi:hypothetical protein